MEWQIEEQEQSPNANGGLYVKVMTDEQMEVLRQQISVYATICEQLVEMHKAITAQQDLAVGLRLGNSYCDPLMVSCGSGHKITARQRWTPTAVQLEILERIFEQGNGTPSKQKIKEITTELGQHGHISETNVYNWFQNRRARSKRKQIASEPNIIVESEQESESPKEKSLSLEKRARDAYLHGPDIGFEQLATSKMEFGGCYFQGELQDMGLGGQSPNSLIALLDSI
ncbi:hypothetical protein L6164_024951 [Bauhinia variegata]|uniref:Uncharacterized protein n=1 Tax=Bauhinia variegata TaxID=167791 RepID=A0ACB9LZY9_BAUVA|nr:hypothetical protein L6164_024951 [Bauhinia variegata]